MYKYTYQLVNINKNLFTSQVTYIFVNLDIKKKMEIVNTVKSIIL